MKKVIALFIVLTGLAQARAQNINPEVDYVPGKKTPKATCCDAQCSGWVIDANITGGFLWQGLTTVSQAANYTDALNANISTPKFNDGVSRGIDVEAGYFFGPKRNFGIGAGLMFTRQHGNMTMDNFHVEYRSTDYFGNTFRQLLTSNGSVKESINTSNLSIPILFKYKTWFTKKVGFTADAGILINLLSHNEYNSKSSFDYEAIYKYSGEQGNVVPVYDNSPVPAAGDLLITKAQYMALNSTTTIDNYFNTLRSDGYNVGLGIKPNNKSGSVSYNGGSVGILLRPAVSIALAENFSLNVGLYYLYTGFSHDGTSGYRTTNKVGEYSSMLNGVSSVSSNSFGLSVGIRYSFCKPKQAAAAPEPAPSPEPAPEEPVASPVDADDEEPAEQPKVDISTPILFEIDKTEIRPSSYPVLEEAVKEANENSKATLMIHGYTDNTGTARYNKGLSVRRAAAVKNYLKNKGVKAKQMRAIGHGEQHPAASNKTSEGRAKNRRAVIKLKGGK